MIRNTKQDWSIGKQVKVGFLTLTVVAGPIAIKDSMPDIYILQSSKGQKYEFIPHNGLNKID